MGTAIAAVAVLACVCYNVYRHPAAFRNLPDNSLPETQPTALQARESPPH